MWLFFGQTSRLRFLQPATKETMNPEKRHHSAAAASTSFCINPEPAPAPSPVTSQLNTLRIQLDDLDQLVGRLIDSTRSILSGDPRHESVCQSPDQAFSCPLEQDIYMLSERVSGLHGVLSRTLKNIQL